MNEASPSRPGHFWLQALGVALAATVVLAVAGRDFYFRTEILELGDQAANAIRIGNAKHFTEIYGNYSRFEFSHPGPAFFYVEAAGEFLLFDLLRIVPSPYNAHVLASLFLQGLFLGLTFAILADRLRWRFLSPVLAVAAAIHFSQINGALVSVWPPHVLLAPFACFLAAVASVASGRIQHLPVLVLAGGFLFHGHVAQALFVGLLGIFALWSHARGARRAGQARSFRQVLTGNRRLFWFCLACVAIFLAPLAIDLATRGTESNVATIVRQFVLPGKERKTLLQSVLYLVSFSSYAQEQDAILKTVGPATWAFFGRHLLALAVWAVVFAAPLAWYPRLARRLPEDRRRFFLSGYAVLGIAALLCVVWGISQVGPMFHMNGFFYHGFYFFALMLALAPLAWYLEKSSSGLAIAGLYGVAVGMLFFNTPRPGFDEASSGRPIRRGVETLLKDVPSGAPVILSFEHKFWPEAASVALQLQRTGHPFYVAPRWNFMFGPARTVERLGTRPEDLAQFWWLGAPDKASTGQLITETVSIYSAPPPVDPRATEIRFGPNEMGSRYVVFGLSDSESGGATTMLERAVLHLGNQPGDRDVRVTFDVETNVPSGASPTAQPAEIRFNGVSLGRVVVEGRTRVSVVVPKDLWSQKPGRAEMEIFLPDAVRRESFRRPAAREWYGWKVWGIRFEAVD